MEEQMIYVEHLKRKRYYPKRRVYIKLCTWNVTIKLPKYEISIGTEEPSFKPVLCYKSRQFRFFNNILKHD